MSETLYLRKGLLTNLADAPYVPGALSVTTDERAMYLDVSETERIRLGDFIQVADVTELYSTKYYPYSTTALYYVEDVNGLYKYSETAGWKLINEKVDITLEDFDLSTIENNINANSLGIVALQAEDVKHAKAIGDNTAAITAEVTRATEAEAALGSRIDSAEGSINALSTRIDSVTSTANTAASDIAAEITRATAAENKIREDLGAEITNLDSALDSLEGEFSGHIAGINENINSLDVKFTNADNEIRGAYASADTQLKTDITNEYIAYVTNTLAVADAMQFKGVLTAPEQVPTTNVHAGHTYKIGKELTYGGTQYRVGDLMIADSDQGAEDATYTGAWVHVSSGYEDDYDAKLNGDVSEKSLTLLSGVDAIRGKLKFTDDYSTANGGVQLTMTVVDNPLEGDTVTVSASMVWGSF